MSDPQEANMARVWKAYVSSWYVPAIVLFPVFAVLIVKNRAGSKYVYISQISWLTIALCVGSALYIYYFSQLVMKFPDVPYSFCVLDALGKWCLNFNPDRHLPFPHRLRAWALVVCSQVLQGFESDQLLQKG